MDVVNENMSLDSLLYLYKGYEFSLNYESSKHPYPSPLFGPQETGWNCSIFVGPHRDQFVHSNCCKSPREAVLQALKEI